MNPLDQVNPAGQAKQVAQQSQANLPSYDQTNSDSVEFALLLQLGLDFCQKWGVRFWTDFNQHDPGVTILEQLCYAITDLNYRASFPVADILAEQPQEAVPGRTSFFTGNLVLTGTALTIDDYRKYLYDAMTADGPSNFKNVWLEPASDSNDDGINSIEGLYDIFVETFQYTPEPDIALTTRIKTLYQDSRNLTEDVRSVTIMQEFPILVTATVEIDVKSDPNEVLAQILFAIQNDLVPFVNILSPDKLLQKGIPPDQIYEGPLLKRGVITSNQFTALPASVAVTTINNIILGVSGVVYVSNLSVNGQTSGTLTIPPTPSAHPQVPRVPRLEPSVFQFQGNYPIQLTRQGKTLLIDTTKVAVLIAAQLSRLELNQTHAVQTKNDSDYTQLPKGSSRDIASYFSIQRQFPKTYGIGEDGPQLLHSVGTDSAKTNATRLAQAKQLKAYLLFFEQLLSNSLAQLANAARLFSLDETLDRSYFWQSLVDPDIGPPDIVRQKLLVAAPARTGKGYRYNVQVRTLVPNPTTPRELLLRSPWYNNETDANANSALMLTLGTQSSSYQTRELPNNEFLILLIDHNQTTLGFGAQRFTTHAEAQTAIARLVILMREMTRDMSLRAACMIITRKEVTDHIVTQAGNDEDDTDAIAYYLSGMNALVQRYDPFLQRRNRFLDNMLARFNQSFDDALLEAADPRPGYMKDNFRQDLIQWKNGYLKRFVPTTLPPKTGTDAATSPTADSSATTLALGGGRGKGLNPTRASNQIAGSMSGMEQRITYLLGLGGTLPANENRGLNSCDYQYAEATVTITDSTTDITTDTTTDTITESGTNQNNSEINQRLIEESIVEFSSSGLSSSGYQPFVFQSSHPTIMRSLLAHGKDVRNYSVEKDPDSTGYYVVFRWPDENLAKKVTIAANETEAQAAIKKMASYLQDFESGDQNTYLDETVYLVDHIMLRNLEHPTNRQTDSTASTPTRTHTPNAFYSFRISLMFPDWPIRFQDAAFRELAHTTATENCPAHVQATSYWLNTVQMGEFRLLYLKWLALLTARVVSASSLNAASAKLVDFIRKLDAEAISNHMPAKG